LAATIIRTEIDRLEEKQAEQSSIISDPEEEGPGFKRVVYGSRRPSLSVAQLGELMQGDNAFRNFRTKLGSALARLVELPRVVLQASYPVMWISSP